MDEKFVDQLYQAHKSCDHCPSKEDVGVFFSQLLGLLFPNYSNSRFDSSSEFKAHIKQLKTDLVSILDTGDHNKDIDSAQIAGEFFDTIPSIHERLKEDVQAMYEGDPAAMSTTEVIRSYPGFCAISAYRFAHFLVLRGIRIIPRIITEYAHSLTGIDIHPNAQIGRHFCIDHGTGVVIGETTIIGDHVKIYQGVTLGALSVNKADAKIKRHPTIGDRVVIYAGATILGGQTVIGNDCTIGGNVWITKSVPENTKVYYQNKMITESRTEDSTIYISES